MTLREIKRKVVPILETHGISRAALFGSYARGEARSESDLDILVDMPSGKTLFDLVELKLELEEALGMKVDLLTYDGLYPRLRKRILSEQVAIR